MQRFHSRSDAETRQLAHRLAPLLPERGVVLLIGDLGAGKTTFAKGVIGALGAGSEEEVTSPTYTLVHEYGDPLRVYHIDLYRLESAPEVLAIGFDELLEADALLLIEWGERFPELLPRTRVEIRIGTSDDDTRTVEVTGLPPLAELKHL